MTTSFLCSTSRLAFSMTISATWTWRVAGSSKVLETTSPLTLRSMSVTSSGRSSMSSTMRNTSGWLAVMELAMFCSSTVLPVRGGATMRARWPWPRGVIRSMTRVLSSWASRSMRRWCLGYRGTRSSKCTRSLARPGGSKFTASTRSMAKNFSPSLGGRIMPESVSPVRRLNLRIWLGEM